MFKRIKNLLDLSKYTVKERYEITSAGLKKQPPELVRNVSNKKPATIVDLKTYNPLDEFPDDTVK